MQIAISEISVGKRLREVGDVSELAASIKEVGLLNPITITPEKRLVAGAHRLKACKDLGWTKIEARSITLDELNRELAEIDENLIRNELTALEEAMHLERRKEIHEQKEVIKHGGERNGAGRPAQSYTAENKEDKQAKSKASNQPLNKTPKSISFLEDTKKATGQSRATIKTKVQIGKKLKKQAAKIKGTKIEDSQKDLLALAKMAEPEQDAVIEKIQQGAAKNVKEAKQAIQREAKKAAPPATLDDGRCELIHADIENAARFIADASVDFIITDPPYPREYLPLYETLAKESARILKPGGSLLVMIGQSYLPEILALMAPHIRYHWTLAYLTPGGQSVQLWQRKVNTFWKPVVWLVNGEYSGNWIGDVCKSSTNDNDKRFHDWGQSESGMADLIERLTYPEQVICDPFLGGGTTGAVAVRLGRRFIGMDISEEAIATARQRIAERLNG
jgi:site-specific DNA-methyltransferase (adenine-specific)